MSNDKTHLAHHFDDLEQQNASLSLGMWIFLVTEVMIFGGLFAAYTVYRWQNPTAFSAGSNSLNWKLAGINTVVLISSSFTMVLALYGAQIGRRKLLTGCLLLTILLALVFLGLKAVEYTEDYHGGLIPVDGYFHADQFEEISESAIGGVRLFMGLYLCMTGLHAVHMVAGIAILAVLTMLAWRDTFSPEYHAPVEMAGLYWHFVDVFWIFLLPLLYLSGTH